MTAVGPRARLRRHAAPLLWWSALCALFFAPLLLGRAHLPAGDFSGQFHAFAQFQAAEMAQGRLPLWAPGSYGGFPFAGDIQSAAFYPLRWLTIAFSLPWGFTLHVLQIEAALHIWLAGLFTYALAYHLTRVRAAALLGAIAFGLGGYLTSYPLLQLAILESVTWLPLILLFVRLATRRPRPLPWLLGAGLLLALSALTGHPQTLLHVLYAALLYYLFCAVRAHWSWRWLAGGALLIPLTGLGAAAVALLPAVRWTLFSTRAGVSYAFVATGQDLLNTMQLVAPGLLTVWSPEYVGLVTLLLALFAWSGRRLAGDRAEIWFWSGLALLAFWLALGEEGILFRLAYRLAPGFALFRQQERLWGLVSLSLALLGAQGLALWLQRAVAQRRRLLALPAAVVALALLFAVAYLLLAPGFEPQQGALWLRQALFAALIIFLLWRPQRRWTAPALLAILAVELFVGRSLHLQPGAAAAYWRQPPWMQALQSAVHSGQPARIDSQNHFLTNIGPLYGLEDIRGISPLKPAYLDELERRAPLQRRWSLLNVTHVLAAEPLPGAETVVTEAHEGLEPGQTLQADLYRVDAPFARARLLYEPLPVGSAQEALQLLAAPDFDPAQQVILHGDLPPLDGVAPPPQAPQTAVERLQSNRLRITVQTETPGLLVASEWRYPGWRATLDGVVVPIYAANYAFQAIHIPAGAHTVELQYTAPDVAAGALISALFLLAAAALAWRWRPPVSYGRPLSLPHLPQLKAPAALSRLRRRSLRLESWLVAQWRVVMLATVAGGFALRLFRLGVQELRGDEGFSYFYASMPLRQILPALIAGGDPHPPLHYLMLGGWLRLAGESEFAMRYLSVLLSILFLALLFPLGRRVWGVRLGLLLAALMAVSQSQVWLAQDVRSQYMLALLFTTLAAFLLPDALARPLSRRWWLYAGLCALAMYSHYYSLFALLAHGLYVLVQRARRCSWLSWLGAGAAALLLFAPWLVVGSAGWRTQLFDPGAMRLAPLLLLTGRELVAGPAMADLTPWLVLGAGLLALGGFHGLWRRARPWAALLGGWLALATLGVFLILLRRATFNPFYLAVAAPAWWSLLAVGVLRLPRLAGRWQAVAGPLAALSVAGLLLVNGLSLARYYGDPLTYGRTVGYRPLAAHLEAHAAEGDLFLLHFPDPALTYYLRSLDMPTVLQPAEGAAPQQETEAALAQLAAQHRRIWFAPYHNSLWDPQDVVFRWLDYHLILEEERSMATMTLQAYRPLHAAGELLQPVGRTVAQALRLEGAHLTVDGLAARGCPGRLALRAGSELNVSLVWQAVQPTAQQNTVFVHLLAADGRLLAQHDGVPAHGTRPTDSWREGERLLDEHLLQIAETTPAEALNGAQLVAGMYDTHSGERRAFDDGSESVLLCTVASGEP